MNLPILLLVAFLIGAEIATAGRDIFPPREHIHAHVERSPTYATHTSGGGRVLLDDGWMQPASNVSLSLRQMPSASLATLASAEPPLR